MRATKFKLLRLELNHLQVDVARRAYIDRSRLSLIENGHIEPSRDELERLATALGVPVGRLGDAHKVRNQ